ncbi:MAG: hypothetical protein QXT38_03105 [Candidatus Aenigmatarchaeota archaeon]
MANNQLKNNNDKENQKKFEEILARESPELFLELKKFETEPKLPQPSVSGPLKFLLFIGLINVVAALILTLTTKRLHFLSLGTGGMAVFIPWWLARLNGLVLIVYGIKVIKNKEGMLHSKPSRFGGMYTSQNIRGESAKLLGLIYILLGIFLLIVPLAIFFIPKLLK